MPALCRDCCAEAPDDAGRCPHCRSPRMLRHAELATLSVAHVDCDAFYASVEKRDDPSLADKPVIVGGSRRGVVATCCYVARTYGIRSAMPMFKALALCPDATVIRPDMEKYARVGREIRAMMEALTPLVEPVSIDEAYLDLTGTERAHGASPAVVLARFARDVETRIGVSVSVGLSCNRFLAKIASDLDKPRGFAVIGRAEAADFLRDKPVGIIPGVGPVARERLAKDGIRTIGDVARMDLKDLARRYGEDGLRLARLARGEDTRKISPDRETKSVSSETTFEADIADPERLTAELLALSEKVARRLRRAEICGSSVTLKLKTADFRTRTRARSGLPPTQLAVRIHAAARDLLAREADGVTKFRLIGVGVSDLRPGSEADRGDLLDTEVARTAEVEKALDRLRGKFGNAAVLRGSVFDALASKNRKG
jgi:DNA polymerase-4